MNIRKFFDAAPADSPASTTPSIAALMASQGTFTSTGDPASQPITIQETKVDPPAVTEPLPAATAEPGSSTVTGNPENPTPTPEPVVEAPQPIVEPPAPAPSWQEVLKKQQPDAVLKEVLGDDAVVNFVKQLKNVDPKMVAFLNIWQSNGDVSAYLREMTTDYSKMSAEDVMRHHLRQEYPTASQEQLDALYNRKVVKAYSLDSDDEDERSEGKFELEAEADKVRKNLTRTQSEFLLPKPPEPKQPEPDPQEQLAARRIEEFHTQVKSDPYSLALLNSRQLTFGDGDEKFNYPVDATQLQELLLDNEKWAESLFTSGKNAKGEDVLVPNLKKQYLVAAILADKEDGHGFLNAYAQHFKSIGAKAAIAPIENASTPTATPGTAPAQQVFKSVAEAMAKQGRLA